jgi:hypothetical protein
VFKTDLHVLEPSVDRKSSKLSDCVQGKAQCGRDQSFRSKKGWLPYVE